MAFLFNWPEFADSFYDDATKLLNQALNKGDMPPIIADKITVKDLHMGTIPPELEILEIGELTTDRFRGIFRLSYSGDASIELKTRIQANPLVNSAPAHPLTPNAAPLFAAAPLIVPMTLKLSSLQLRAILTLVISKQKGITLVVKNDALESLHVSSSFDSITAIQTYIQREIESKVKELIRSDLPNLIHRLSQSWLAEGVAKSVGLSPQKVHVEHQQEQQELDQQRPSIPMSRNPSNDSGTGPIPIPPVTHRVQLNSSSASTTKTRTTDQTATSTVDTSNLSVPESIESFDPTYGMRPNALPAQSAFNTVLRLWKRDESSAGLKNATRLVPPSSSQHPSRNGGGGTVNGSSLPTSPSMQSISIENEIVNSKNTNSKNNNNNNTSVIDDEDWETLGLQDLVVREGEKGLEPEQGPFYERVPAVGGGTITRPRVFHVYSQLKPPNYSSSNISASAGSTILARPPSTTVGPSLSYEQSQHPQRRQYEDEVEYHQRLRQRTLSARRSLPSQIQSLPSDVKNRSSNNHHNHNHGYQHYQYCPHCSNNHHRSSSSGVPRINVNARNGSTGPSTGTYGYGSSSEISPHNTRTSGSSLLNPSTSGGCSTSITSPPSYSYGHDNYSATSVPTPTTPSLISMKNGTSTSESNNLRPRSPPPLASHSNYNGANGDENSPGGERGGSGAGNGMMTLTISPSKNDSCAHLTTLTQSHQTLSPYTRSLEHFTSRSFPRGPLRQSSFAESISRTNSGSDGGGAGRNGNGNGNGNGNYSMPQHKANRKRVHRIGQAKQRQIQLEHEAQAKVAAQVEAAGAHSNGGGNNIHSTNASGSCESCTSPPHSLIASPNTPKRSIVNRPSYSSIKPSPFSIRSLNRNITSIAESEYEDP